MTTRRRSGDDRTPFGKWLRDNPRLQSQDGFVVSDADWVWHQCKVRVQHAWTWEIQNLMWIEEKQFQQFRNTLTRSQQDTLSILGQLINGKQRPRRAKVWSPYNEREVTVRFWGGFLLQFSHSGPGDSEWIKWHGKYVVKEQLEQILRFELSPLTLKPRDERNHHGGARQKSLL